MVSPLSSNPVVMSYGSADRNRTAVPSINRLTSGKLARLVKRWRASVADGPALGREIAAVGGQREGSVGVVDRAGQRIVHADEDATIGPAVIEIQEERVERRFRDRCDVRDRARCRIRSRAVGSGRVQVDAAQLSRAAAPYEHSHEAHSACQLPLHRDVRLCEPRLGERRRELHTSRGEHDGRTTGQRIRVAGMHDRLDLLMAAVELHRLLVALRIEPVEEDAAASTNGRLAVLEWRPGDSSARPEVDAADVLLTLLADATAERQRRAHAIVVLKIDGGLHLRRRDPRIADVAREGCRLSRDERIEAREREGTGAVAADVVP